MKFKSNNKMNLMVKYSYQRNKYKNIYNKIRN